MESQPQNPEHRNNPENFKQHMMFCFYGSVESKGGSGSLLKPPFETKLFYFHGEILRN